ncbi:DUF969 domain-containing protein [Solihabitans fulvus]|uniref:DUF969 domain-containing protein n=1 Tax=Solihabitans fulvus TaxID=1892852 RepID=A0A5B2XGY2_9PSEU|nr:DUF969 domain-containing protein [Solihabitans fulvus]KAA2262329.1 DUF969 domain-containing protein [Solihabitans fulvus]
MLVLLGVLLVVVGFALRLNPLLVVTVAGIATALLGGLSPLTILNTFGTGFATNRTVTLFILTLPVIGLVERFGLQQEAGRLIGKLRALTVGRMLAAYLLVRQLTAALGLKDIAGPAQTLRPLIAPMALGAAERKHGRLSDEAVERVKAFSASADTVGLFFGEDVFLAVGSVLLITSFVDSTYHLKLDALQIAIWAIPTAICAFVIHGARLLWLDRQLARMANPTPAKEVVA